MEDWASSHFNAGWPALKRINLTQAKPVEFSVFDTITYSGLDLSMSFIFFPLYASIQFLTALLAPTWHFFPRLSYIFALLCSWITGFCIKEYAPFYDPNIISEFTASIALRLVIPCMVFHCTLNIDYHTLGRILGPVLFIGSCLFFINVLLLTLIMCSISNVETTVYIKLVHALSISMISVGDGVRMLDKAQCQVRQLQILLQGEMLLSIALNRYLDIILLNYVDFNKENPDLFKPGVVVYMFWTLMGILPGLIASYIFRQYVNYSYDDCDGQAACVICFYTLLYNFTELAGCDGSLSVLAFGISLGTSKIKFSTKAAQFYGYSQDLYHYLSSICVFAYSGWMVGTYSEKYRLFDASYIVIVFATCLISRTFTFVLLHRMVTKMNMQISWKHLTVAIQTPSRGAVLLAFTILYHLQTHLENGRSILVQDVILICMSYMVNLALMKPILTAIGMFVLTRAKVVNMNVAVMQVNECRSRAIQGLKVDRVIADANWIVVDSTTQLQHPYKKNTNLLDEDEEDFESKGQSRIVYCGECGMKGAAPLSEQEMEDVALDIKHRILKAQRVSFNRQHDNGTLSRHGVKILSNLVERVLVRDEPILTAKDLRIQRMGTPCMQRMKTTFRNLFTITSKKHAFIPTFWLRSFCFRVSTSRRFQITMACLSMFDLILLIRFLYLFYADAASYVAEPTFILQGAGIFFYTLFVFEFLIEILGKGVIQYYSHFVNLVEFACSCLVRTLELGMFLHYCLKTKSYRHVFELDPVIMYVKTLLVLRVTRIYVFIVALIPKILNCIDKKMDEDLIKIYDIGKAYLITQEQVMKFLGHLVTNDEVYDSIYKVLDADRMIVASELGLIKFDRTTIATTNKTSHAIRHVVNTMQDCIRSMKEEESLDILETQALLAELEAVKAKTRNLSMIEPLEPHFVISEIPWLKNDPDTISFFLKHARISSYSKDEIIISQGDVPCGLIVVIQGLVKVSYVPSAEVIDNSSMYGALPNYDFFINLKFQLPQEEYITGCAVIGETGVATGRQYDTRAVCMTSVHTAWFPIKIIKAVVRESGNAMHYTSCLWKVISIKIAVNVMQDTPQFRGWSRERLFMYLQGGVVPVLEGINTVTLGEHVQDTILIQGLAMDHATRMTYVAPYYIPRTVATLLLTDSPMMDRKCPFKTVLFIIPSPHADAEDISGRDGLFKECIQRKEREQSERESTVQEIRLTTKPSKEPADQTADAVVVQSKTDKCKRTHGRNKMSAYSRRVLKAQKRTMKTMKFVEYIPTMNGPIERSLVRTTFVESEKKRGVGRLMYPKSKFYDPSFGYISDVRETSEIRELKGDEEEDPDDRRWMFRRSSNKQRTASWRGSRTSNLSDVSASRMTMDLDADDRENGQNRGTELKVLESSESEQERCESKPTQTNVYMIPKLETDPSMDESSTGSPDKRSITLILPSNKY